MPQKAKRSNETLSNNTHMTQCLFWAEDGTAIALCTSPPENGAENRSANYVMISNGRQNFVNYMVVTCDFYDISSGQARLVLKDHIPGFQNYDSAGNLFRTFMNNMYEYYR